MLPAAAEGDPEGQGDERQVEAEAAARDIEEVVAELLPARDVAWGVDLRQARQPRTHAVPQLVSQHVLEPSERAALAALDLCRHQRPRADEAHVAEEDIPELG